VAGLSAAGMNLEEIDQSGTVCLPNISNVASTGAG